MAEIGARIRQVRGALTQAEFAKRLGLTREAVANYETGKRLPGYEVLSTIAGAGNTSVTWLLFNGGQSPPDNVAEMPSLRPEDLLKLSRAMREANNRYKMAGVAPGGTMPLDEYLLLRAFRLLTTEELQRSLAPIKLALKRDGVFTSFFDSEELKRLRQIVRTNRYESADDKDQVADQLDAFAELLRKPRHARARNRPKLTGVSED